MSEADSRSRALSIKERIDRRRHASTVLTRTGSAAVRFNALTALLNGPREPHEVHEALDLLEQWLMGRREAPPGPRPPIPSDVVNRLQSGEEPTALFEETGLTAAEAVQLDRLSAWFAAAALSFDSDSGDGIKESLGTGAERARELLEWVRSGDPIADWVVPMLALDLSDRERMHALERITSRLGSRPIHPARWRANRRAITEAADALGVSVAALGLQTSWAAVHEAIADLTVRELRLGEGEAIARFRRALERLVCSELLPNHDWGRSERRPEVPVNDSVLGASLDPALEQILEESPSEVWAALRGQVALTQAEEALCDAFLHVAEDGGSWADAARQLGIEQPAMRQRKSALLRKLKQAAGS